MATRRDNVIEIDPKKGCSAGAGLALLLLVAVGLLMSFHIVPPGHRGVKVTLGTVSKSYLPEGISMKMPFITKVDDVPVKQITVASKGDVFSSDLQNITFEFNVLYRIPENRVVALKTQYAGEPYETLVDPRIQERLKQVTSTYRAEDLVKKREEVKRLTVDSVRAALGDLIEIVDLTLTNIVLSKQLEAAIEQKVIREQEALAKRFELEKAETEAEITIVEAKAEAESIRVKGEALTSSPMAIELEIARKWDGKAPQSVVTSTGGANVLLPIK